MAVPEFPLDALDGTDEELGKLLLAWFIASEADIAGIALQEIPEEFGKEVVTALHTAEATVSAIRRGQLCTKRHKATSRQRVASYAST